MRRFADIVKGCDKKKVLFYLRFRDFPKQCENRLEKYDTLYRIFCDWNSEQKKEALVLTGFDVQKGGGGEKVYLFNGITFPNVRKKEETVITDFGELKDAADILVPDTLTMYIPKEFLVGEIFRRLEFDSETIGKTEQKSEVCAAVRNEYENRSFTDPCNYIEGVQKRVEQILDDVDIHDAIINEILEYFEVEYTSVRWDDLLIDTILYDSEFSRLDRENPPFYVRGVRKQHFLARKYESIVEDSCGKVKGEGDRIIIAPHGPENALPLVYVRDRRGKEHELREFSEDQLLRMDIRIFDPRIDCNDKTLAVLIYYLEYNIRLSRIKKRDGVAVFLNLLKQYGEA